MKRFLVLAVLAGFVLAGLSACGKKKEEAVNKNVEWELSNFSEGITPPPKPKPLPKDITIEVPKPIKARYSSVIMAVGNRKTREVTKFTVKVGDTASVPGTGYTIKIAEYLPHWTLKGKTITSMDENPVDPAVRATIFESGKPVFDGFIFQKHKTPSFFTEDHVIALMGTPGK